eukprot:353517-Chlamydomonas_euryale.AAC.13
MSPLLYRRKSSCSALQPAFPPRALYGAGNATGTALQKDGRVGSREESLGVHGACGKDAANVAVARSRQQGYCVEQHL